MRKKILALGAALVVALGIGGSIPAQAAAPAPVMVSGQNVAAPVNPTTGKPFPTTTKAPSFKPGEVNPDAPKNVVVKPRANQAVDPITRKTIKANTARGAVASKALITPTYWYANGGIPVNATPIYYQAASTMTVNNPWVDTSTRDHSIGQMAIIREGGAGARQTIEFGWGTNTLADGDMQTRLWAGMHINSVWQDYNVGFVAYNGGSPCGTLGSVLVPYDVNGNWTGANGTNRRLEINYTNGAWWLACGGAWIGYIDQSGFPSPTGGAFTTGDRVVFFGEVYSDASSTCSDMGEDGVPTATSTAGAYFTTSVINGASPTLTLSETDAGAYDTAWPTSGPGRSFRYGGDAYC